MRQRRHQSQRSSHSLQKSGATPGAETPFRSRFAVARALATVAVAVAALAGCTPGTAENGATAQPSASQGSAEPSAEPSSAPPGEASPAPSDTEPQADAQPSVAPELPTVEAGTTEPVSFETGVTVRLDSLKAVEVEAGTPGEVAGSAVQVNVRVQNKTANNVEVDSAVVSLAADGGEVGIGTTAGGATPLAGSLAPGTEASATYVFMLENPSKRDLTVSVNYAAGQPVAVFSGSID